VTAASYEVCAPWAGVDEVVGQCCKGGMSDTAVSADAFIVASSILYGLTGRRWPGECTDTIRPTAEHASVMGYTPGAGGWRAGLVPFYDFFPGMWGYCGCERTEVGAGGYVSEIALPGYPVTQIVEVKVDGVAWPSSYYRVQDRSRLVLATAAAGRGAWPCHQDLTLADNQPGTWSITYKWGAGPPRAGVRAAAALACELYKAWTPSSSEACVLPERVTTVVRQGVTVALLDTFDIFDKGMTGIASVDLWIASLKAGRSQATSAVFVPDHLPNVRRDNP
jgi:hypothetical protein